LSVCKSYFICFCSNNSVKARNAIPTLSAPLVAAYHTILGFGPHPLGVFVCFGPQPPRAFVGRGVGAFWMPRVVFWTGENDFWMPRVVFWTGGNDFWMPSVVFWDGGNDFGFPGSFFGTGKMIFGCQIMAQRHVLLLALRSQGRVCCALTIISQ